MPHRKVKMPRVPILRHTIILMVLISILYPVIFSYINHTSNWISIVVDILITIEIEIVTAVVIYWIILAANKILYPEIIRWYRFPVELLAVMGFSFCYLWMHFNLQLNTSQASLTELHKTWQFRQYIGINLLGTLFIYLFESSLNLFQLMQQKAARAETLQKEFAQVRLQALKNQVNPHFLFNSLSVLSTLVHVNADQSEKFILQLSKAYRYILDQKDAELVSLRSELEFLDAYFFLMQIRFDKKILLQKEIGGDPNEYQLPPLTLQLLVENAVKHNKMSLQQPLCIELTTGAGDLTVTNNINKREQPENSTGIGLENIKSRYAMLGREGVKIMASDTTFKVLIPLIKNRKK